MGQRTQVWIEVQGKKRIIDEKTRRVIGYEDVYKNYVFHEQWGYGKGLINRLIMLVFRDSMARFDEYDEGIDWNQFFSCDTDLMALDDRFMEEYRKSGNEEALKNLLENSVTKYKNKKAPKEFVEDFLEGQDNDNGYLLVRLGATENNYGNFNHNLMQFGFYEYDYLEEKLKEVSWQEYLKNNSDEDEKYLKFVKAFFDYMEYQADENTVLSTWDTPLYELNPNLSE